MAKYEKWLGAGLGFIITGNPVGGLLGFLAGALFETGATTTNARIPEGVRDFEVNLMVLASHLIKIDGEANHDEINFVQQFLNTHFDSAYAGNRAQILNHCLQKEYDLTITCGQLRQHTTHSTRVQIVHFLFDLGQSDGTLNERENYFIFRIAGYLNVNDVEFRRIKNEHTQVVLSVYEVLGVKRDMQMAEIRTIYRKLVLKYHPDRNKDASEKSKRELSLKFQQIQEAYEAIKAEKGG